MKLLSQVTLDEVKTLVFRKRDNGQESAAAQIRNLMKRIFDYAVVCGVALKPLPRRFRAAFSQDLLRRRGAARRAQTAR